MKTKYACLILIFFNFSIFAQEIVKEVKKEEVKEEIKDHAKDKEVKNDKKAKISQEKRNLNVYNYISVH